MIAIGVRRPRDYTCHVTNRHSVAIFSTQTVRFFFIAQISIAFRLCVEILVAEILAAQTAASLYSFHFTNYSMKIGK